jgi:hypothetical protein
MSAFHPTRLAVALLALLAFVPLPTAHAQEEEDVFAFMPDGGRTLLRNLIDGGLSPETQAEITGQALDAEGWVAYLEGKSADNPTISELDDYQTQTLASYLSYNMPLEAGAELPWDGRDMALERCQSCHIITVVVTQDRERETWLGTMHKPSHIEVPLAEAEREELADYLVLNAGIPIDDIPPALRAGGASY